MLFSLSPARKDNICTEGLPQSFPKPWTLQVAPVQCSAVTTTRTSPRAGNRPSKTMTAPSRAQPHKVASGCGLGLPRLRRPVHQAHALHQCECAQVCTSTHTHACLRSVQRSLCSGWLLCRQHTHPAVPRHCAKRCADKWDIVERSLRRQGNIILNYLKHKNKEEIWQPCSKNLKTSYSF